MLTCYCCGKEVDQLYPNTFKDEDGIKPDLHVLLCEECDKDKKSGLIE